MLNLDFQHKVLKLLATNVKFAQEYGPLLKKQYFDDARCKNIFDLIKNSILSYDKELDKTDVLTLADDYCNSRAYGDETRKDLYEEVKLIFKENINNEQLIIDNFLRFAKQQEFKNALIEGVEILEKNRPYEEALKGIEDAVSIGTNIDAGLTWNDLKHLPTSLRIKYDPSKLIRTGFHDYDMALQGGMAPGEVHVIQAPPKSGKSTFGCNCGAMALITGKTVYHVTLEISAIDVLHKYAARLTNWSYDDIMKVSDEEYTKRIGRFKEFQQNLFVNYWTEKTITTLGVRAWISRQRSLTGKKPDLIIMDYDDLLSATTGVTEMYEEAGQIYSDLKQLADYFDCPILTFAQPRRDAWLKYHETGDFITCNELAHSAKKAHKAFSISSLNFKKNSDIGYLYVDINRRGVSNKKIKLERNLDKAVFMQIADTGKENIHGAASSGGNPAQQQPNSPPPQAH